MAKVHLIVEALRDEITRKVYVDRLPPMRTLAERHGVNLKTISKAVALLAADGLVSMERGRGTFIRPSENGLAGVDQSDRIVALLVRDRGDMFATLYAGLVQGLQSRGLFPLLIPHAQEGGSRHRLDELVRINPRALIIDSGIYSIDYDYLKSVSDRFRRLVFLTQRRDEYEFNRAVYVLSDYFYGAYMAVRHLAELGHRRILLLRHRHAPGSALVYRHERITEFSHGFQMAMEEFGLAEGARVLALPTRGSGLAEDPALRSAFLQLFASPDRPTAILSFLDYWLLEAATLLQGCHLSIPGDVSLVGCHNTQWVTHGTPHLTSISLREEEIARIAVEKAAAPQPGFGIVTIKPEMVVRASTGRMG